MQIISPVTSWWVVKKDKSIIGQEEVKLHRPHIQAILHRLW